MLCLIGPTAAGKTALGIELAKALNGEIISADSMQVYRGMDIGTAKPTTEEQQGIPHHLINIRNPDENWTVSDFIEEAQSAKIKFQNKGKVPIMVGGTGLYINAWLNGFSFPPVAEDEEIRKRLEFLPASTLHAQLSAVDPMAATKIHPNNKKRLIRALEVYEATGRPISELQENRRSKIENRTEENILIGLNLPRDLLYQRINQRVDEMIATGLIEEVEGLLKQGFTSQLRSLQALGYKEVIAYLDGKWAKEEMIVELKKRIRHFARRQLTWFRSFENVKWFEPPFDLASIIGYIKNI
ncbi:tRNA (adenosine(37)-N6)-dimethylallyltransferase MiaA [Candidatus Saganbacteria bacterium]|nr:tRNA (adenosine(37)-N6)-dimethylallyltransferase MiaA [Candidatus Saganbacteria bacterium]